MLYERILKEFQDCNLSYAVIGGIAVNLHGYNRVTGDLDIIIALDDENVGRFISVVEKLKLVPRLPVQLSDFAIQAKREEWIVAKRMKVFSVYNSNEPLEHIDVKIDEPEKIDQYLTDVEVLESEELVIPVVNIDVLIEMKKESGRERDLIDVKALEKIKTLK